MFKKIRKFFTNNKKPHFAKSLNSLETDESYYDSGFDEEVSAWLSVKSKHSSGLLIGAGPTQSPIKINGSYIVVLHNYDAENRNCTGFFEAGGMK